MSTATSAPLRTGRVLGHVDRGAEPVPARMFLGGQWRDAGAGVRLDCVDPTTEELLGTVPAGTAADADLAGGGCRAPAALRGRRPGGRPAARRR
jgi:acyl-CoA reductase-like NAD-dependent aldehyde dehydrogenase